MATKKKTSNKKATGGKRSGRPPMIAKAGPVPKRYCGGGKLK